MFNLSYQEKPKEFFTFIQEKIAKIASDPRSKKSKSSIVAVHVSGVCRAFNDLVKDNDQEIVN